MTAPAPEFQSRPWLAWRWPVASLLLVVCLPLAAMAWLQSGWQWPCPLRFFLDLPCAACGATRALAALARFDLPAALALNPLFSAALLALPFWPLLRKSLHPRFLPPMLWTLLLSNWLYLLFFLPP